MVKIMGMVTVDGDEYNLLHALAFFDRHECHDGHALRSDLEDFARQQHRAQQEKISEQELQQASPPTWHHQWKEYWVIIAYSLMKKTRVFVHTLQIPTGAVSVEETSHSDLHGKGEALLIHLFNDSNTGRFAPLLEIGEAAAPGLNLTETLAPWPPVDFASLAAPVQSRCRAYVACWTTQAKYATTAAEEEELLRLAGWLFELLCMPPPSTAQMRTRLRAWQSTLRDHFGRRLLPWPWSFVVHGLML